MLLAAFCATVQFVHADFSDEYAINPPANGSYAVNTITTAGAWTRTGSATGFGNPQITLNAPISLTLDTSDSVSSISSSANFRLSTTIVEDGLLSFSYSLSVLNTLNNRGGYYLNGVFVQLASGSHSVTDLAVEAGDVFGFGVAAGPHSVSMGIRSRTMLTVSNFDVAPVPEPTTMLFGAGLLGFCLTHRRRTGAVAA